MATVTVKCNLPNGVILRAFKPLTVSQPVLGGGMRDVTEYQPEGGSVVIKGTAVPRVHDDNFVYPVLDRNRFAITTGVDKELWDNWLAANKNSAMVVNGCIYAVDEKDAEKADRAHKGLTSNMQPLARDGDPRMPKRKAPQGNGGLVSAGEGER